MEDAGEAGDAGDSGVRGLQDSLPAPARPPGGPNPADRRRLDLHACLTGVGILPLIDDLHAINVLSTVDDATYAAVRGWITRTF
ncbi:hypothetical protein [Streptomyces bambusae]|uniref:Uncharacterized protein n=1 Tax=Streptomyces bambusae TaxID=1550616 RepID=A0ABS6Z032_9ACTN|nr:hypothetical protein [Streptomyces bambusae]MBW5481084.1 hypothetical protein [Streptomyces bambusae]